MFRRPAASVELTSGALKRSKTFEHGATIPDWPQAINIQLQGELVSGATWQAELVSGASSMET